MTQRVTCYNLLDCYVSNIIPHDEVNNPGYMILAGLVPPAAAVALLGKFGAILIVIVILMAIT